MNEKILIYLMTGFYLSTLPVYSQTGNETLTVQSVTTEYKFTIIDEKEGEIILSLEEMKEYFENAKVTKIIKPEKMKAKFVVGEGYMYADDERFLFEFTIKRKKYNIGVGPGSKFIVQKKEGKYTLLPNETVKESPPPKF